MGGLFRRTSERWYPRWGSHHPVVPPIVSPHSDAGRYPRRNARTTPSCRGNPVPTAGTGAGGSLDYAPPGFKRVPFPTTPHRGHWRPPVRRSDVIHVTLEHPRQRRPQAPTPVTLEHSPLSPSSTHPCRPRAKRRAWVRGARARVHVTPGDPSLRSKMTKKRDPTTSACPPPSPHHPHPLSSPNRGNCYVGRLVAGAGPHLLGNGYSGRPRAMTAQTPTCERSRSWTSTTSYPPI